MFILVTAELCATRFNSTF